MPNQIAPGIILQPGIASGLNAHKTYPREPRARQRPLQIETVAAAAIRIRGILAGRGIAARDAPGVIKRIARVHRRSIRRWQDIAGNPVPLARKQRHTDGGRLHESLIGVPTDEENIFKHCEILTRTQLHDVVRESQFNETA